MTTAIPHMAVKGDGLQLESDATSAESDPTAPVASVQSAWSAVLSDDVNEGTDLAGDDLTDANTVATRAENDLTSLQTALAALFLRE